MIKMRDTINIAPIFSNGFNVRVYSTEPPEEASRETSLTFFCP